MPELPEVETVVRGLGVAMLGRRFAHVQVNRADLRWPLPVDLGQRLVGARVTSLSRRAKYGLITTDRDDTILFHLGMSGRMRVDPPEHSKHDHIIFSLDDGRRIAFNDARRFGSLDLVASADLAAHKSLAGLGPEPLEAGFTAAHLRSACQGRQAPIKNLLLDQTIVAGLGNIYVCEALFMVGLHPATRGGDIAPAKFATLVTSIRAVLTSAIAAGGSSLRDFANVDGELGYFQKDWSVYGREGEPCHVCARPIQRIVQGGRSSFFCAHCQRAS